MAITPITEEKHFIWQAAAGRKLFLCHRAVPRIKIYSIYQTRWDRLISPWFSPLGININPENNTRGNQKRTLRCGKRKTDWLWNPELEKYSSRISHDLQLNRRRQLRSGISQHPTYQEKVTHTGSFFFPRSILVHWNASEFSYLAPMLSPNNGQFYSTNHIIHVEFFN